MQRPSQKLAAARAGGRTNLAADPVHPSEGSCRRRARALAEQQEQAQLPGKRAGDAPEGAHIR